MSARQFRNPTDWYDLTIYGFYCLEAAVMAAATQPRLPVTRTHPAKAAAAETLARDLGLPDVSVLLPMLNAARKAAAYGDTPFRPSIRSALCGSSSGTSPRSAR